MEDPQLAEPTTVVADIQDLLLDTPDVEAFLEELARHSASIFSTPGNEVYCGITLMRRRSAGTVASSGERAKMLDELQYKFADGPCLHACREITQVHIPDFAKDTTWPEYNELVTEHGIRSVLAVPFPLSDDATRAGLNLYSEHANAFDQAAVQRVNDYVQQASKGLRLAVLIAEHSQTATNLRAAMESRTVIDVATGVIIAQNRCTQQEAMELIKKASSNRNVKLRVVAQAIVESAGGGQVQTYFK
ncbi:GAF and ANTAR domain-containing protein [Paenarthrobacter aurescens]|nr:GAF and ANTAR domain-containing protein [Paenarthrobacter aurescens]MDO6141811.1 GAF and ANTAR domain-containing protein [Paenarthrobacter aurescens]MDO6149574.1 GAF and ANTAR domain-containing protein [Paenarthrobacter aurescens]MDO6156860.1 GAF and ANTAR domain-containing protein [Paenarthrobacter aurescens]MDO6160846.1 GAF and ANTAR domain-containing protein [Paenarthrobacter aurescens]